MNQQNNIPAIVDNVAGQYVSTVSQYKWSLIPDSQLYAAKNILTKNDYIERIACQDPQAVQDALIKAAVLGLDLTEGKRQGWLIPRKSQKKDNNGNYITNVQLQVGYKGVEAIHQRMGVIDRLVIRVIYENDLFEWSGDDQEKPNHQANWLAPIEERGKPSGAYAITYFPNKDIQVVVTPIDVIYKNHRDRADSWKSYQAKKQKGQYAHPPPWVTDEVAMIEKTMAYIASKQWPANIRNEEQSSKILETLHEVDISDYATAYSSKQRDAFYKFLNNDDGLGMRLLEMRTDIEEFASIVSDHIRTIKKGDGRMEERERINNLAKQGAQQLENIKRGIIEEDPHLVLENAHGSTELALKVLNLELTEDENTVLQEMVQEGDQ